MLHAPGTPVSVRRIRRQHRRVIPSLEAKQAETTHQATVILPDTAVQDVLKRSCLVVCEASYFLRLRGEQLAMNQFAHNFCASLETTWKNKYCSLGKGRRARSSFSTPRGSRSHCFFDNSITTLGRCPLPAARTKRLRPSVRHVIRVATFSADRRWSVLLHCRRRTTSTSKLKRALCRISDPPDSLAASGEWTQVRLGPP